MICLAAVFTVRAEFNLMKFNTADGRNYFIGADGLELTVSGENLNAVNTAGESLELPLEALVSMEFSNQESALESITCQGEEIEIYTLSGLAVGTFRSLPSTLPAGVYVVRNNSGVSFKIAVRQ